MSENRCSTPRIVLLALLGGMGFLAETSKAKAAEAAETSAQIFERRILPIFKSPNPSSCTQCHLAAVDLKNYILPSHEKTFLSLRDQGLIDLDNPEKSKILHLIQMGAKDDNQGAALLHAKVRQAEYEAFAAWIKASCADARLRDAPKLAENERAAPPRPVEVIRHARKDRLLQSFENNVWAMRFRCMNCHIEGTEPNNKYKQKFGARVAWIKSDAAETMNYLLASKLLNVKEPEKSLLLQKPLGEVKHEGGKKFLPGDQGYKAFRAWIEDYARTVGDRYTRVADLPTKTDKPERFGTDIWLKLDKTPPAWGDRLLQVTIYAWDADRKAWEDAPIAASDRGVWGKGRLWQHNLTLIAAKDSERARQWKRGRPSLPPGRYLVKVHVDTEGRLAKDWRATLTDADYAGEGVLDACWQPGYGSMSVLDAAKVRH
ncbi:MAG TPA: hypothetical protein VH682_13935 [Gemmataceae bacterium]|jgi:hypothetical protein